MINSDVANLSYLIQRGVVTYPISFKFHFNENNSPQLLIKIGDDIATINVDYTLADDNLSLTLIPTEIEAAGLTGPDDYSWMDRIVGKELLVQRNIPFIQPSDYTVGRISPEQIEYDLDASVMRDQQLAQDLESFTVDVALAESLAHAAVQTANDAVESANNAIDSANNANETANSAVVTANEAKSTAEQASQDAVDAMADAASAVNKASSADLAASQALELAATAVTTAQNAENTVSRYDDRFTTVEASVDANADAIQKTRSDYIQADSEIHQILNNHAGELTTLHNDVDEIGDQVSGIEEKIPGTASASNPLVTKQQLLDEEMDIREDLNSGLSELQTQVTAQAAAIAEKQDKLTAGENITIVDNVISAAGGGASGDYLPLSGGELTGELAFVLGDGTKQRIVPGSNVLEFKSNSGTTRARYSDGNLAIEQIRPLYGSGSTIGSSALLFDSVYTRKLNNGADLIIPTQGGTLARLEDLEGIGGGGAEIGSELDVEHKITTWFFGFNSSDGYIFFDNINGVDSPEDVSCFALTNHVYSGSPNISIVNRSYGAYEDGEHYSFTEEWFGPGEVTNPVYPKNLGRSNAPWQTVFATKLNNGADLAVPTEGGTLARVEDIMAAIGDINTILDNINGEVI